MKKRIDPKSKSERQLVSISKEYRTEEALENFYDKISFYKVYSPHLKLDKIKNDLKLFNSNELLVSAPKL